MQVAASMIYRDTQFKYLIAMLDSPEKVVNFYLGFNSPFKPRYRPKWVASLCSSFRYLPKRKQIELANQFESALVKAATLNKISGQGGRSDIEKARYEFSVAVSSCRANSTPAQLIYNKTSQYIKDSAWIDKPWLFSQSIEAFKQGETNADKQLENFDSRLLISSIDNPLVKKSVLFPELFLALAKIGSRLCQVNRCTFSLSSGRNRGVITGRINVQAQQSRGRWNIRMDFDLASHPYDLLRAIAPPKRKHGVSTVEMQARALVKSVYLMQQGGKKIRLIRSRNRQGLQFRQSRGKVSNKNLYLYVEMQLDGTDKTLSFPLF